MFESGGMVTRRPERFRMTSNDLSFEVSTGCAEAGAENRSMRSVMSPRSAQSWTPLLTMV